MKIRLNAWHGVTPRLTKLVKQRLNVDLNIDDLPSLDMTLDEFLSKWQDKFIVLPKAESGEILVAITEYGGFGMR